MLYVFIDKSCYKAKECKYLCKLSLAFLYFTVLSMYRAFLSMNCSFILLFLVYSISLDSLITSVCDRPFRARSWVVIERLVTGLGFELLFYYGHGFAYEFAIVSWLRDGYA